MPRYIVTTCAIGATPRVQSLWQHLVSHVGAISGTLAEGEGVFFMSTQQFLGAFAPMGEPLPEPVQAVVNAAFEAEQDGDSTPLFIVPRRQALAMTGGHFWLRDAQVLKPENALVGHPSPESLKQQARMHASCASPNGYLT